MRGIGVGVVLVGLVLVGCSGPPPEPEPAPAPTSVSPSAPSTPSLPPVVPAVVALGDSITAGFAACGSPSPCERASWATGADPLVDSLRRRLDAGPSVPEELAAVNLARPGARAADLAGQASRVDLPGAGLVTVLIGANDVCASSASAMTPPEEFRASLDRALAEVRARAPQAAVLVASVPDVAAVADGLESSDVAQSTWARTGVCRSVLDAAADPAVQAAVSERVAALDRELVAACAAVEGCTDDDGAVSSWRPALDDLSELDAFHPSVSGQAQLAELLWPAAQRALSAPVAAAGAGSAG